MIETPTAPTLPNRRQRRKTAKIVRTKIADKLHVVHTVEGTTGYCLSPCSECPWRISNTGSFPAEAFRISANTAEDQSFSQFGCHMAGVDKGMICAGFLHKGADNNIGTRLAMMAGAYNPTHLRGHRIKLHASYRAMAIANGVTPDDPAITNCRANDELLGRPIQPKARKP